MTSNPIPVANVTQLGKPDANGRKSSKPFLRTLRGKKKYPRPDIPLGTNETSKALQAKTDRVPKMSMTWRHNKQMQ